MRLIDADAVEEKIGGIISSWHDKKSWIYFVQTILRNDVFSPTIDAVPVIRCKDCKHWGTGVAGEIDGIKCCKLAGYMVTMSGYCVYGEAKDAD